MKSKWALELKNVSYQYPDGHQALKEISFKVAPGERVGIIGPNGAGKTTLLLAICGLIEFKGEIKIFGELLTSSNSHYLRRKLGLLFQDPNDQLFMPRIYEDVAFGPKHLGWSEEEIQRKVKATLKKLGLEGFESRSGHHLSFGEKKRCALATVLVMEPEILLFDEPTSNLDPRARREFINILKQILGTQIIISHDLEMILRLTSRVITLDKGEKICEGETQEILSNPQLMESHGLEVPASLLLKSYIS